jgi:hypothetical protein
VCLIVGYVVYVSVVVVGHLIYKKQKKRAGRKEEIGRVATPVVELDEASPTGKVPRKVTKK